MANYVLLTEINAKAIKDEWWMDCTGSTESMRIFDTFEKAKAEMRKTIKHLAETCEFFPYKNGHYTPIEDYAEDIDEFDSDKIKKLGRIIDNTINNPDYCCKESDYNIADVDNVDWYFAFVGNKDFIVADHYEYTLKMNIHNMTDDSKSYYFNYFEADDYGRIVNFILIRLLNDANTDKKN